MVRGKVVSSNGGPSHHGDAEGPAPFVSRASLCPVALLVFFPAAARAGVVAADFVIAVLNSLRRDWFFSAIEDEWGERA